MSFVKYEAKDQIGIITIDRPKALNALNSQVLDDLEAVVDAVDYDVVRCLILTGSGEKSFVAGADIAEMAEDSKAEGKAFAEKGWFDKEFRKKPDITLGGENYKTNMTPKAENGIARLHHRGC